MLCICGYMDTSRRFLTAQIQIKMSWFPVGQTLILALFLFLSFFCNKDGSAAKKASFPLDVIFIFPFHTKHMQITSCLQCTNVKLAVSFKTIK